MDDALVHCKRNRWLGGTRAPRGRFVALRGEALEARTLLAPVNGLPTAVDDSFVASEEPPLTIAAPGVLANDQDPENDKLTAAVASGPAHGTLTLTLNAAGSFFYVPAANYSGPDAFTYKANDGQGDSNIATVSLVVNFLPDGSVSSRLLVDIDQDPVGIGLPISNGLTLMAAGGLLYFNYDDQEHGLELWRTDGTGAGTSILKDFTPGPTGRAAFVVAEVSGAVFLSASDGTHGQELWKTDGTTAGTQLVKDIRPGSGSSGSYAGVNVNGTLLFRANDGVHGYELWKSDGTASGTVLVKSSGKPTR